VDPIETAPREESEALQLRRMQASLRRAYDGVARHRAAFDAAGFGPRTLRSLADLRHVPFTTKDDVRDTYPYGMLAVPREQWLDELEVRVEARAALDAAAYPALEARLCALVKASIGVTVSCSVVPPGGVERSQGKAQRVVDLRGR
jgi:phenylacetate-coenzyme A ligase PaaK-like adenylate-forming protein